MNTRFILCCLFFTSTLRSFPQKNERIDSLLETLAQASEDTNAVLIKNELSRLYRYQDLDTAEYYALQAHTLARRLRFSKGIGITYNSLGVAHYFKGELAKAKTAYDSALHVLEDAQLHKEVAEVLNNVGIIYETERDFKSAITYHEKSLELRRKIDDEKGIGDSYNNIGLVYYAKADYKNAILYLSKSLEIDRKLGDSVGVGSSYINIGSIQKYLGNYDIALHDFHRALTIFSAQNNFHYQAYCYTNLAEVHFELGEYDRAILFYRNSLNGHLRVGNELEVGTGYYNIGKAFDRLGQEDSAVFYLNESLSRAEAAQDLALSGKIYHSLGLVALARGHMGESEKLIHKSISLKSETEDHAALVDSYATLGKLYVQQNKIQQAEYYYFKALDKAKSLGIRDQLDDLYLEISRLYRQQSNPGLALRYMDAYLAVRDTLLNEQKQREILALGVKYELEKMEEQLALKEATLEQKNALIEKRLLQRNVLIGGSIVIFIITILLWSIYRVKLKATQKVNKQSREFEALRSHFFAGISHEFRTPLTLITAPVRELIGKYKEDQETQWNLQLIERNASRLLGLINQLLNLSKLEAGKLKLQIYRADIYGFLRIIGASFQSFAQSKQINFGQEIPPGDLQILFDKEKIEQIVVNLLSNAFKFVSAGGNVTFSAGVEETSLFINVKNDGKAIPREEQSKIFDRFYQVPDASNPTGSGVGLALVRELTELHHGRVEVNSTEAHTSFTVLIPLPEETYAMDQQVDDSGTESHEGYMNQQIAEALGVSISMEEKPVILVVEDNDDLRKYICNALKGHFACQEAKNGLEGLEKSSGIPDLIITDLMMPDMDGMEMLATLRQDPKTKHIPIVMLTARAEMESKLAGIEQGADHYLFKPFDVNELITHVRSLIAQRNRIRDHYYKQFITRPEPGEIQSADNAFLDKAVKTVENNLSNSEFTVDRMASELNISRTQLHRKLTAIIGCSASEFIRHYRLRKAHEWLTRRKGTVSEIAFGVGFNNLSYFAKCFRELYHVNPSEMPIIEK